MRAGEDAPAQQGESSFLPLSVVLRPSVDRGWPTLGRATCFLQSTNSNANPRRKPLQTIPETAFCQHSGRLSPTDTNRTTGVQMGFRLVLTHKEQPPPVKQHLSHNRRGFSHVGKMRPLLFCKSDKMPSGKPPRIWCPHTIGCAGRSSQSCSVSLEPTLTRLLS